MRWGQGRTPIAAVAAATVLLTTSGGLAAGRSERPGAPSLEPARETVRTTAGRRTTAKARAARLKTRYAFSGQRANEAIAVARDHHRILGGPLWMERERARVVRFVGERSALIRRGARTSVLAGSIPLRTRASARASAAIDLSLERAAGGYRSRNPLVEVTIGSRLRDGIELPASGVSFQAMAQGERSIAAELRDGRLFWPNAAIDTDVVAMPTPLGVETFVHLRSERSPERVRMPFDLPRGARLIDDPRRDGGFRVMRSGATLVAIDPPFATDADGASVPMQAALEGGSTLVLSVSHRAADVTYPILVDPSINAIPSSSDPSAWSFTSTPGGYFHGTKSADGMVTAFDPYLMSYDERGTWWHDAPGNSRIDYVQFLAFSNPAPACTELGIHHRPSATTTSSTWICDQWGTSYQFVTGGGSDDGPYAAMVQTSWNGSAFASYHEVRFSGATLTYSDPYPPEIDGFPNLGEGWQSQAPATLQADARDDGVGVKTVEATERGGSWLDGRDHPCTGDQSSYCPNTWTTEHPLPALSEGRHIIDVRPTDLQGLNGDAGSAMIRVDRSPPAVTVSGPLRDAEGTFADVSTLHVAAADGSRAADKSLAQRLGERSGVKTIELLVNGAPVESTMDGTQQVTQTCAAGSCALERDLDFDPGRLATGTYAISVRATDQIGNTVTTTPFSVKVDKTPPTIALSGSLYDMAGSVVDPGDYELRIVADDGDAAAAVGVDRVEVLVDGLLHPTVVPADSCPEGPTKVCSVFTYTGDAFTPGRHDISVVVTDRRGNQRTVPLVVYGHQELSPTAVAVGFEEHFALRSIAAGAGSTVAVNLGSGNFSWHHRPISDAGRGLWTNVDVTYNSRSSELDLGHGYDEVGEGFSLAISSLTRVNEALDVRWVDKNNDKRNDVVTLTDADGTMHRFKRRMDGSTATDIFDPPPGVNVHLRRFYASPQTAEQRRKVWAATLPDGVTHFFDECGYERSAEDRNGNALTFTYEEEDRHPQTQGRRAKLLSVTDAGRPLRAAVLRVRVARHVVADRLHPRPRESQARLHVLQQQEARAHHRGHRNRRRAQLLVRLRADRPDRGGQGRDRDHRSAREPHADRLLRRSRRRGRAGSEVRARRAGDHVDRPSRQADDVRVRAGHAAARDARHRPALEAVETETSPPVTHELDSASTEPETTRLAYDGEQNVEKVESPRGTRTATVDDFATSYQYDAAGRQTVERRMSHGPVVEDLITSFAYDERGNLIGVADPVINRAGGDPATNATQDATQRISYVYDLAGRRTRSTEHLRDIANTQLTTILGYDANGNLIAVTDPRGIGYTTTYQYDGRDLLSAEIDPEGGRTEYELRGDQRVVGITKPNGTATAAAGDFETRMSYDPMGDLLERTIPRADGQATGGLPWNVVYTRDEVGDAVSITDGRGRSFTNEFFDTGDLKRTGRPSWWQVDGTGIVERDPNAGPAEDDVDADAETTQPGLTASGDFGDVTRRPLPGVLPRAGVTEFEYDQEMRLVASRDVAGNRFALTRDAVGRVEQTTQPFDMTDGPDPVAVPIVQRFRFDHNGNLGLVEDGDGHRTELSFDQFERLERRRAPGAATGTLEETLYGYDENGNLLSIQTPRGPAFSWRMTYDRLDRLTSQSNPRGDTASWEDFDAAGNPRAEIAPRGNLAGLTAAERAQFTTRRTFDALNRVTTITDGLGHETRLEYDADSNLIEIRAPGAAAEPGGAEAPQITRLSYDGRDLPYSMTTGTGAHERTTITEFDPNGNLRRRITPRGVTRVDGRPLPAWPDTGEPRNATSQTSKHATVFEYDADNLLRAVHQPWGDTIPGDQWSDQNGRRYVQELDRDERGRIIRVTPSHDPDDPYEAAQIGRRQTQYTHFQNGWIKTATDPDHEGDGNATVNRLRYRYDRRGHQIEWRFERQEGTADPVLKREITRVFAPNRTLSTRGARRPGHAPRTYDYTYNANHSLTSISDGDPEGEDHGGTRVTRIEANKAEQPVLVDETWNGGRDSTFTYDANGNVRRRQTEGQAGPPADPSDLEQPYTYSGADARTTAFHYDAIDRELWTAVCQGAGACSATEAGARITRSDWYPSGQLRLRTREPNGVQESRFFFDDGRIARMRRVNGAGVQKDQQYTYDLNGNRTQDERGQYLYNARSALIRWTRNSGTQLAYDLLGSRAIRHANDSDGPDVTYDYSGDRLDRMVSTLGALSATATFEYDQLGAVRFMRHDSGTTEYGYDEFERLRTAKGFGLPAGQAGDRYCYDALDRRALRIESSNTSATCATATADTAGAREHSYVGLSNYLAREETSGGARSYDYDSAYTRLGRSKTGEPYRSYALDANGTVEGLERTDGSLPANERYPYDPYGRLEPTVRTPSDPPSKGEDELATDELKDNPFRFQGFYYDAATQTYDMHARDYRPDIARFLSQDRYADAYRDLTLLADPTSQNRYAFAGGDPVGHVEIDGHQDFHAIDTGERGCLTCRGEGRVDRAARAVNNIAESIKRQAAETEATRRQVLQQNVVQALQQGAEKRAAANLAELYSMQQPQLNFRASQLARQLAAAQGRVPDAPGFWDFAKAVFDPTDPVDWLALGTSWTGAGAAVKGAKTAHKVNKLRKAAQVATRAARAVDRLSSRAGAAVRNAAANFRVTSRLRQCAANSFSSGTPILMADGTRKPIDAVRVGDLVVATDPATGATVARRVTALIRGSGFKRLAVVWAGDSRLTVTDDHPFYVAGRGWIDASALRRGDLLATADGRRVAVEAVLDADRPASVYNLTVADLHTYYAGRQPILVHNQRCDSPAALAKALQGGGRAPELSRPYGMHTILDDAGNVKQVTTYDRFGRRARQYDVGPGTRHGEGFHEFEYGLGFERGARGEHVGF
jgi:RHS repeat-associated protein